MLIQNVIIVKHSIQTREARCSAVVINSLRETLQIQMFTLAITDILGGSAPFRVNVVVR